MVVILHYPFPGYVGEYVSAFSRIGVPFFFLVSGYFSNLEKYDRKKGIKKIQKYLLIDIGVTAVYLSKDLLRVLLGKLPISQFVATNFTPEFWLANFGSAGHIWFIRALLYIELFKLIFYKRLRSNSVRVVALVIWIADVLLIKYSFVFGFSIPQPHNEILTKMVGTAFLYYLIGIEMKRNHDMLCNHTDSFKTWASLLVLFGILLYLEKFILDSFFVNAMPANYLFTSFLTLLIFVILIQHPMWGKDTILNHIGGKLSMYIYYWHILVGAIAASILKRMQIPETVYKNALFVFGLSIITALLICAAKDGFRIMKGYICVKKTK